MAYRVAPPLLSNTAPATVTVAVVVFTSPVPAAQLV